MNHGVLKVSHVHFKVGVNATNSRDLMIKDDGLTQTLLNRIRGIEIIAIGKIATGSQTSQSMTIGGLQDSASIFKQKITACFC